MSNEEIVTHFFEILADESELCNRKIRLYEEIRSRKEYDGSLDSVLAGLYDEQKRIRVMAMLVELFRNGTEFDEAKRLILENEEFKAYIEAQENEKS